MKHLTILTILLLLSSCSSKYYCRKAQEKGCYKVDSVIVKDTLILTDYDTMVTFSFKNEVDTLILDNGITKTQVITKWKTREQKVTQKDTIVLTRKVPQIQVKQLDCHKQKWWDKFWIGFVCGIVFSVIMIWFANKLTYIK